MAEVILMPRLSDTMTEGVIAAWHKKVGDSVKKGDLLAEVETDKATMDLESYKDGTLLHIGVDKGGKLQVNDLLAIIGAQGEDVSELIKKHSGNSAAAQASAPAGDTASSGDTDSSSEKKTEAPPKEEKGEASPKKENATPSEGGNVPDLANMQEVILMPRLSDTMTEGVIAAWHKNVGDAVSKGDLLAEIETDKATMDLESYKQGKLLYIGAQKGEKVPVNALLCIIGEEGKVDVDKIVAAARDGGSKPASAESNADKEVRTPAESNSEQLVVEPHSKEGVSKGPSSEEQEHKESDARVKASPLAKKMATEKGINISEVKGSGDNGRIIKKDVDSFVPSQKQVTRSQQSAAAQASSASAAPAGQVSFDDVPVSQMRKVIAKRLAESKFTAPEFYLTMSIDMDAAVAARTRINEGAKTKISFNDIVLKAVAIALKQHPKVNSSWMGDKIRVNHHINIGVAVAVEDGLLVPVVRFADTKSLSQISTEVKDFAQRAKDKKLQPADWEGSTFTISNLGMFGIDQFTAIINPPDSCILAVGGIFQEPVVKEGQIKIGNVMKVTLTCDHRVVDGATGAAFLQTLKTLLEEPLRMLV